MPAGTSSFPPHLALSAQISVWASIGSAIITTVQYLVEQQITSATIVFGSVFLVTLGIILFVRIKKNEWEQRLNHSWERVSSDIDKLHSVLQQTNPGPPHYIVTISNGGLIAADLLASRYYFDTQIICINLKDRRSLDPQKETEIIDQLSIRFEATDRILVLDNVTKTGGHLQRIYRWLRDAKGANPDTITLAVMGRRTGNNNFAVPNYVYEFDEQPSFPWPSLPKLDAS